MEPMPSWFEFLFGFLATLSIIAVFAGLFALAVRQFFEWTGFKRPWEDM
jgi:ABC-type multidrug transport system permease subunit